MRSIDGVSGGGDGGGEPERLNTEFITGLVGSVSAGGGGGSATTTMGVSSCSCCNCLRRRRSSAAARAAPGLSGVLDTSSLAVNREKIHCEKKNNLLLLR